MHSWLEQQRGAAGGVGPGTGAGAPPHAPNTTVPLRDMPASGGPSTTTRSQDVWQQVSRRRGGDGNAAPQPDTAPIHVQAASVQVQQTTPQAYQQQQQGAQWQRLLSEARRSKWDAVSGKARCLGCGQAFPSYAQLAQHIGSKHGGVNSEDAKYMQYHAQATVGGTGRSSASGSMGHLSPDAFPALGEASAYTGKRQAVQRTHPSSKSATAAVAKGSAVAPGAGGGVAKLASRARASTTLTLADILKAAAPKGAAQQLSGPKAAARSTQPAPECVATHGSRLAAGNASPGKAGAVTGQKRKVGKPLTISFGTFLHHTAARQPVTSSGVRRSRAAGMGRVAVAGGGTWGTGQTRPVRRKLRVEGAEKKKRVSTVKRLVKQQRADRELAAAQQELQRVSNAATAITQFHDSLTREITQLQAQMQQQTEQSPQPQSGTEELGSGIEHASASTHVLGGPVAAGLAPPMRLAVLQVSLPQMSSQLRAALDLVHAAQARVQRATAARASAYKLPIDPPADVPAPSPPVSGSHSTPTPPASDDLFSSRGSCSINACGVGVAELGSLTLTCSTPQLTLSTEQGTSLAAANTRPQHACESPTMQPASAPSSGNTSVANATTATAGHTSGGAEGTIGTTAMLHSFAGFPSTGGGWPLASNAGGAPLPGESSDEDASDSDSDAGLALPGWTDALSAWRAKGDGLPLMPFALPGFAAIPSCAPVQAPLGGPTSAPQSSDSSGGPPTGPSAQQAVTGRTEQFPASHAPTPGGPHSATAAAAAAVTDTGVFDLASGAVVAAPWSAQPLTSRRASGSLAGGVSPSSAAHATAGSALRQRSLPQQLPGALPALTAQLHALQASASHHTQGSPLLSHASLRSTMSGDSSSGAAAPGVPAGQHGPGVRVIRAAGAQPSQAPQPPAGWSNAGANHSGPLPSSSTGAASTGSGVTVLAALSAQSTAGMQHVLFPPSTHRVSGGMRSQGTVTGASPSGVPTTPPSSAPPRPTSAQHNLAAYMAAQQGSRPTPGVQVPDMAQHAWMPSGGSAHGTLLGMLPGPPAHSSYGSAGDDTVLSVQELQHSLPGAGGVQGSRHLSRAQLAVQMALASQRSAANPALTNLGQQPGMSVLSGGVVGTSSGGPRVSSGATMLVQSSGNPRLSVGLQRNESLSLHPPLSAQSAQLTTSGYVLSNSSTWELASGGVHHSGGSPQVMFLPSGMSIAQPGNAMPGQPTPHMHAAPQQVLLHVQPYDGINLPALQTTQIMGESSGRQRSVMPTLAPAPRGPGISPPGSGGSGMGSVLAGSMGSGTTVMTTSMQGLRLGTLGPLNPPQLHEHSCLLCNVHCNSASALQQHLSSKKHLTRVARLALAEMMAAAPPGAAGTSAANQTFVGPEAASHSLCKQIITPELNTVVSDLLLKIKGFQDRAMLKDPIKAAAHRWYVCGLREARKVCRTNKARSVIIAPNIEEVSVVGGLDDHVQEIITLCEANGVQVVFALTRKKMGELYGHRKRVSAVAVLSYSSVEDLHTRMVALAEEGRAAWREARVSGRAPGEAPQGEESGATLPAAGGAAAAGDGVPSGCVSAAVAGGADTVEPAGASGEAARVVV